MEVCCRCVPKLKIVVAVTKFMPNILVHFIAWCWTNAVLAYAGVAFFYLQPKGFNVYYNMMYWSFHIIVPVVTVLSLALPKVRSEKKQQEDPKFFKTH